MLAAAGAARSAFLHRGVPVLPLPADDPAARGAARIAAIPGAIGALHAFPTGYSGSALGLQPRVLHRDDTGQALGAGAYRSSRAQRLRGAPDLVEIRVGGDAHQATGAAWRVCSVRLRRRLARARAWSFLTASSERPIAAAVSATLMPSRKRSSTRLALLGGQAGQGGLQRLRGPARCGRRRSRALGTSATSSSDWAPVRGRLRR